MSVNFYTDNPDLQYHLHAGIRWDGFVPAVAGHAPSRRAADSVIGARLGTPRAGLVRA